MESQVESGKRIGINEWIDLHISEYPGWEESRETYLTMFERCALETGAIKTNISRALRNRKTIKKDEPMGQTGISENDLRKIHDITFQIREAVRTFKPGVFFKDSDFREMVKNHSSQFRAKSESKEFESYHGRASGGIAYWGHPDSIKKLKDDGILS